MDKQQWIADQVKRLYRDLSHPGVMKFINHYAKASEVGEDAFQNEYGFNISYYTILFAEKLGLKPELIEVRWHPEMRGTAGRAFIDYYVIWMNKRLFVGNPNATKECIPTLAHEIAHLAAPKIHHGYGWQVAMQRLGYPAARTHSLNVENIKYHKAYYYCPCMGCGVEHRISPLILRRMQQGQRRHCRRCGTNIDPNYVLMHDLKRKNPGRKFKKNKLTR